METRKFKSVSYMTEELRKQIHHTATELFRKKGLKFTMEDIAREMHVAKKTIYKLYPSKEDLLMDLVKTGFEEIQNCKREILESDLPMKKKIEKVLIAMPDNYKSIDFRNLSVLEEKYPNVFQEISRQLESEWDPIYQLLEEGKRMHCVNDVSLPVVKQMVTASFDSFLYADDLKRAGITYQEALQEMVTIIMKGVWNDSTEQ